ncbi:MAG: S1C family serine protease [Betaproteobacteria bacterium]
MHSNLTFPHSWFRKLATFGCATLGLFLLGAAPTVYAQATTPKAPAAAKAKEGADAEKVFGAIVKVAVQAVPNARSAATLGSEREGSGVVIGERGLILTIGYLIVEADDVHITDSKGRTFAARVIAYDHASGLGLVRTIAPMEARPVPFGDSAKVPNGEPVMIASAGDDGVTFAFVVSKRAFSGSWEYALDQAIYTSPPTLNWSGAALIDQKGKLLGVGSLMVRDASDGGPQFPGNLFVPIDLLKPILADLIKAGHRPGPARPWIGVSTDEVHGRLVVSRVSPEGPGDMAGVAAGDIILAVGDEGVRTQADFYRKVWNRGGAGTDIPLKLLQGVDVREVRIKSIDRVDYFRPRTTY